jgi:hypothetical protein
MLFLGSPYVCPGVCWEAERARICDFSACKVWDSAQRIHSPVNQSAFALSAQANARVMDNALRGNFSFKILILLWSSSLCSYWSCDRMRERVRTSFSFLGRLQDTGKKRLDQYPRVRHEFSGQRRQGAGCRALSLFAHDASPADFLRFLSRAHARTKAGLEEGCRGVRDLLIRGRRKTGELSTARPFLVLTCRPIPVVLSPGPYSEYVLTLYYVHYLRHTSLCLPGRISSAWARYRVLYTLYSMLCMQLYSHWEGAPELERS